MEPAAGFDGCGGGGDGARSDIEVMVVFEVSGDLVSDSDKSVAFGLEH